MSIQACGAHIWVGVSVGSQVMGIRNDLRNHPPSPSPCFLAGRIAHGLGAHWLDRAGRPVSSWSFPPSVPLLLWSQIQNRYVGAQEWNSRLHAWVAELCWLSCLCNLCKHSKNVKNFRYCSGSLAIPAELLWSKDHSSATKWSSLL